MNAKYKTISVLFLIAAACIWAGLSIAFFAAVLNVILFLIGFLAFFLSIGAFAFAKKTDKKVSQVLKSAIEALLNFAF